MCYTGIGKRSMLVRFNPDTDKWYLKQILNKYQEYFMLGAPSKRFTMEILTIHLNDSIKTLLQISTFS